MKRWWTLLLALTLLWTLTACGGETDSPPTEAGTAETTAEADAATPEEVYEAVQENAAHGRCELPACVLAAPVPARCGRTKK